MCIGKQIKKQGFLEKNIRLNNDENFCEGKTQSERGKGDKA